MARLALPFLLAFVATTSLAACSTPPDPADDAGAPIVGCRLPYVGDPNAENIEMEVISLGALGKLTTVVDGSSVSLMFPPQGGRVVFAGVRARNVNPCGVRIAGALRDPISQQVRIDNRITNLELTDDGWGRSSPGDISTFANIAACPNQWSEQDLMDVPYELTVTLTDKELRKATSKLLVTPRCDEPGAVSGCQCQCSGDYVLGMACGGLPIEDAGADATTDAGE